MITKHLPSKLKPSLSSFFFKSLWIYAVILLVFNLSACGGGSGDGDISAPSVSITSPINNETVSGVIDVIVDTTDNVGVIKIEFYVDSGMVLSSDSNPPYVFRLDTTTLLDGAHTITAMAFDAAGNTESDTVNVTVNNAGPGGGTKTPMDFVLAMPTNADVTQTPDLAILISGMPGITGTVEIPGLMFSTNFTTDIDGSATVALSSSAMLNTWDTVQQKAIFIHADDQVTLVAVNDLAASLGAFSVLPVTALGSYHYVASAGSGTVAGSYLAVVGTVDGTTVNITPTAVASAHTAGMTFSVMLDRGDTYQLASDAVAGDLAGSTVDADQPVAVFGGHVAGSIPSGMLYTGLLASQIPAASSLGTDFFTVPLATRSRYWLRFIGIEDNTYITGVGVTAPGILNRGVVVDVSTTVPARITTAGKPVLLLQMAEGSMADGVAGADPCMVVMPDVSQYASSYTFTTPETSTRVANRYANLVVPSSAVDSIQLNGIAVGSGSFSAIGATGYSAATIPIAAGVNRFTGDGTLFGLLVYGWGEGGSENGFCFVPEG